MKLFMVYVGGSFANANIELHDVRFSIGATIEDCHDDLRSQWWGDPKSLHLDSWGEVTQADGYDIAVTREPRMDVLLRLFFVNLGGYRPDEFGELHRDVLVVAPDARAAKARALQSVHDWKQPHRDNLFEVEKAIDVGALAESGGQFVALTKAASERPFRFTCRYVPIA